MTIQTDALAALSQSDKTVLRCVEKGIMIPQEWTAYRATLRLIASGTDAGPLPSVPDYPLGS